MIGDKLFASGNNLMYPRPLVESFADYQFPEEWIREFARARARMIPAPWSALRHMAPSFAA
jgi:hypothetical protein